MTLSAALQAGGGAQTWQAAAPRAGSAQPRTQPGATAQFITFFLDGQAYGIDLSVVREVRGWTETVNIPNAPSSSRGVINLRGVVVPIIDLRARFGDGRSNPTRTDVLVIVRARGQTSGLLVDSVSDIVTVDTGAIRPVPDLGEAGYATVLDGFLTEGDRMIMLISLPRLLGGGDSLADPTEI
jgi:purine-binding chemotaxis protein CheW